MNAPAQPAVRRPSRARWLTLALLALASVWALDWDCSFLSSDDQRARAWQRLVALLAGLRTPDLSRDTLHLCARLALETLATAGLGTALGALGGYVLALPSSRAVLFDARGIERPTPLLRLLLEAARFLLDILRGVPDFAWALLLVVGPGPGPVTGVLALSLSITGILGKIYSELWDGLDRTRLQSVLAAGARPSTVFLYAIQPQTAKSMLSYTLMRAECAVRNASVIGVVGGGGLGGELFDQFHFGRYSTAITLLLSLFALTACTDLVSTLLRHSLHLRQSSDPTPPPASSASSQARRMQLQRGLAAAATLLLLTLLFLAQSPAWRRAISELQRIDFPFISAQFARLASPDLSPRTLLEALDGIRIPLSLATLCTLAACAAAALLSYPMSSRFQLRSTIHWLDQATPAQRAHRLLAFLTSRALALILRATPEVAWLLLIATVTRAGTLAATCALALHSAGVLARVFTEAIDDVPTPTLEHTFASRRPLTFAYAAAPRAAAAWKTYAAFQFEVNLRAGVVLGMVGAGGLGDRFHTSVSFWSLERASAFALAMILLTTLADRTSRALKIAHV